MRRLKNRVTPRGEIEAGKLVRVRVYDLKTKCPVCSEPNPLKMDFWILIINLALNDIPGICPICRSLYTIHVIQGVNTGTRQPAAYANGQT
jgi:phage FluMu protein Com